jgi:hypothetical protein
MKRIIRLTESDLTRIIKRVIKEEEFFHLPSEWDKLIPTSPSDGTSSFDHNTNPKSGKINLKDGNVVYFKCDSPYPRKKDMSTPYYTKGTTEYNNAYNLLKKECAKPRLS